MVEEVPLNESTAEVKGILASIGIGARNRKEREQMEDIAVSLSKKEQVENFRFLVKRGIFTKRLFDEAGKEALSVLAWLCGSLTKATLQYHVQSELIREDTIVELGGRRVERLRLALEAFPVSMWRYLEHHGMWQKPQPGDSNLGFKLPDWQRTLIAMQKWFLEHPRGSKVTDNTLGAIPPLLWVFGADEMDTFERYRKQISQCLAMGIISADDTWREQFRALFLHYLNQTAMYQELMTRGPIGRGVRSANAYAVNKSQIARLRHDKKTGTLLPVRDSALNVSRIPRSMEICAYIRRRSKLDGMDSFAAAIYTAALMWMVDNGYSRLFSKVGIVPGNREDQALCTEYAVPGTLYHNVTGSDFRQLMLFRRMVAFTHSDAKEMERMHSTPIITHATAISSQKAPEEYVLLQVDHDRHDRYRPQGSLTGDPNHAGNIPQMIGEMLRAVDKLETLELARVEENNQK